MVRTKVFVGNLSFTTKENELAKEFEVAGKVISANIITRGPRSLGYGFVEMDNEADAENAVKLLDKKEVDGRPINVEVAKPRQDEGQDANNAQQGGAPATRGGARGRGARRGGRGGARGGQAPQGQAQQGQQVQQGQQPSQGQRTPDARGAPRTRAPRADGATGRPARGGAPRTGGRPARVEGEDNRTPSTTTLFVANLPFSLEDDAFAKVLKDGNLAYKTAHVVKKKTGKSKGFGFIEFDTESDQQKALAALNNKDLEGRPLAVKVALTGGPRNEDGTPQAAPADAVTPTNKPSSVKAAVAATGDKKDVKQEQK